MRRTVKLSMLTLAAVVGLAALTPVGAQDRAPRYRHHRVVRRYVRPQIVIRPGRPLYRRCVDWLELQHRPSGTVLYPAYHCWWVRD